MLDYETRTSAQWARTFLLALDLDRSQLITYVARRRRSRTSTSSSPRFAFPAAYGQGSPGWGSCWQFTDAASDPRCPSPSCDEDRWLGDETQYGQLFAVFDPPTEEEL